MKGARYLKSYAAVRSLASACGGKSTLRETLIENLGRQAQAHAPVFRGEECKSKISREPGGCSLTASIAFDHNRRTQFILPIRRIFLCLD